MQNRQAWPSGSIFYLSWGHSCSQPSFKWLVVTHNFSSQNMYLLGLSMWCVYCNAEVLVATCTPLIIIFISLLYAWIFCGWRKHLHLIHKQNDPNSGYYHQGKIQSRFRITRSWLTLWFFSYKSIVCAVAHDSLCASGGELFHLHYWQVSQWKQ